MSFFSLSCDMCLMLWIYIWEGYKSHLWWGNSWQTLGLICANSSGYFCRDQHVAFPSAVPPQDFCWTQVSDARSTEAYRLGNKIFICMKMDDNFKAAGRNLSEEIHYKTADWKSRILEKMQWFKLWGHLLFRVIAVIFSKRKWHNVNIRATIVIIIFLSWSLIICSKKCLGWKKTSKGNEDVSVHTQTCEWNRLPASLMNIYVNFYFVNI